MKVIDKGHKYLLMSLDGELNQTLTFVKREGAGYPGNSGHHPGTTLQDVMRCLLERVEYLDQQIPCIEDKIIMNKLKECLFLLESRAAQRHDMDFNAETLDEIATRPMCSVCGHIQCDHI